MNIVKCPNCGRENSPKENFCLNCGTSVVGAKPLAYAPLAATPSEDQPYQSYNFNLPSNFVSANALENSKGRQVFLWYKVFCSLGAAASLIPIVLGLFALSQYGEKTTPKEQNDLIRGVLVLVGYGLFYLVPYSLGIIFPRRPFHWVYGMVLLILSLIPLGFSSCLLTPAAAVLLFFWFKPEMKSYFANNEI
jgi:hypothetical protein